MIKYVVYTFLILTICISAASCLAVRENETSNNSLNSTEKTSDSKKDRIDKEPANPPEDKETTETNQKKLIEKQKNQLFDVPEMALKDGFELRCGWYSNPTPGNHWLTDRDGEWILGVQGGHQAEGDYPPEFGTSQWIATNGFYGYGCACLSVKVDKKEMLVLEVADGKARPLSACQNDPVLKALEE